MMLDQNLAGLPTDRYWKNFRRGIVASFKVVVAVDMFHSLKTFAGDVYRTCISPSHIEAEQPFFHDFLPFKRAVNKAAPDDT